MIDWLLRLPDGLDKDFKQRLTTYELTKAMPYVTSIEKMAKEEGRQEGRQEGRAETILRLLIRRRNPVTPAVEEQIRSLSISQLESLTEAVLDFDSPQDIETWLAGR